MNLFRSSLATLAACGLLFSAVAPAFAATPNSYQITGVISVLTDTNFTLVTPKKENFDFARGADTKLPDGAKVGDKVTVHYTMVAAVVDAKAEPAAKAKATPKGKATAKAVDAAAPTAAPAAASPTP